MEKAIEVRGLRKTYGEIEAVRGIDFSVGRGTLFAFLGANGAGKSTTIDIISTLLKPDAGEVTVDGFALGREDERIRASIGIVFQDSLLDPLLTVKENLLVRGSFYGLSRERLKAAVGKAAQAADVKEFLGRPYGKLSGGQRRRADIARALVNTPRILFLDEPTTGLDPQTRRNVWNTIRRLQKEEGMTVFLTTHYMEEAAQADEVIVMGHGEILASGTPAALKERYASDLLSLTPRDVSPMRAALDRMGLAYELEKGVFQIALRRTVDALPLLEAFRDNLENVEIVNGSMDSVFLKITGSEVLS